jgi:hypothetical protein
MKRVILYLRNNIEKKHFEEECELSIEDLIKFVKSWSGYYNYLKINNDDPTEELTKECLKLYESMMRLNFIIFTFI